MRLTWVTVTSKKYPPLTPASGVKPGFSVDALTARSCSLARPRGVRATAGRTTTRAPVDADVAVVNDVADVSGSKLAWATLMSIGPTLSGAGPGTWPVQLYLVHHTPGASVVLTIVAHDHVLTARGGAAPPT